MTTQDTTKWQVTCPICLAPIGTPCKRPGGITLRWASHDERDMLQDRMLAAMALPLSPRVTTVPETPRGVSPTMTNPTLPRLTPLGTIEISIYNGVEKYRTTAGKWRNASSLMSVFDPLPTPTDVDCPFCGAVPGNKCSGYTASEVMHPSRRKQLSLTLAEIGKYRNSIHAKETTVTNPAPDTRLVRIEIEYRVSNPEDGSVGIELLPIALRAIRDNLPGVAEFVRGSTEIEKDA